MTTLLHGKTLPVISEGAPEGDSFKGHVRPGLNLSQLVSTCLDQSQQLFKRVRKILQNVLPHKY